MATPVPPPIALLTREEIKQLLKEALLELEEEHTPSPAKALTEEDLSRARKNLRRFGRGT